jgi:hypothetical protein
MYDTNEWGTDREGNDNFEKFSQFIRGNYTVKDPYKFEFIIDEETTLRYEIDRYAISPSFRGPFVSKNKAGLIALDFSDLIRSNKATFEDIVLLISFLKKEKTFDQLLPSRTSEQIERMWHVADDLEFKEFKDALFPYYLKVLQEKSLDDCMQVKTETFQNCSFSLQLKVLFEARLKELLENKNFEELLSIDIYSSANDSVSNMVLKKTTQLLSKEPVEIIFDRILSVYSDKKNSLQTPLFLNLLLEVLEEKVKIAKWENLVVIRFSEKYKQISTNLRKISIRSEIRLWKLKKLKKNSEKIKEKLENAKKLLKQIKPQKHTSSTKNC